MLQIKITRLSLSPIVKSETTYELDNTTDLDEFLYSYLEKEVTPKEDVNMLIHKYNLAVKRFNRGTTESIVIFTHPEQGVIMRIIIDIYQKIGKEIGRLL